MASIRVIEGNGIKLRIEEEARVVIISRDLFICSKCKQTKKKMYFCEQYANYGMHPLFCGDCIKDKNGCSVKYDHIDWMITDIEEPINPNLIIEADDEA